MEENEKKKRGRSPTLPLQYNIVVIPQRPIPIFKVCVGVKYVCRCVMVPMLCTVSLGCEDTRDFAFKHANNAY